ncbi:MAG: toll/interleukin-1 receptor domain-containing protein [Anaerolineales bacterium]|nr:toll/interleukin-1 receptor domain-containing protein [Anaerolineales bacterium]
MTNKLRVFLCHSSTDKPIVREIYQRLESETWLDPWLDEENLLPGMDWDMEIEKAVEAADAVIVCVSTNSVSKEGYIQRELKFVLDIALEKPEGTIFIIPLRLDACDLPRRLRSWQYVDYFPETQRERAYQKLLQSLKLRHGQDFSTEIKKDVFTQSAPDVAEIDNSRREKIKVQDDSQKQIYKANKFDVAGLLLLLMYFIIEVFVYLNDSTLFLDYSRLFLLISTGLFFIIRQQIPMSTSFKTTILVYMFLYPIVFYLLQIGSEFSVGWALLTISSVLTCGSLIGTFQAPMKKVAYSSISLGVFLLLVATQLVLQTFGNYDSPIFIIQFVATLITSILIWMDL